LDDEEGNNKAANDEQQLIHRGYRNLPVMIPKRVFSIAKQNDLQGLQVKFDITSSSSLVVTITIVNARNYPRV
jgi:hypothetical protein